MGYRQWLDDNKFLILILVAILLIVAIGIIVADPVTFVSPISPLRMQAVEEELNYLDGKGEIKWYEGFFIWEPTAQMTSYPFLTGTVSIHWQDADVGLMPVSVPYTTTNLIIELELRGAETYTQVIDTGLSGVSEPDVGVFHNLIWIWIDVEPGLYDEYIKAYWIAGNEIVPLQLVKDGEVVEPISDFALYREDLLIPHLIYLPIMMKQ